ncbi:hypothetical protein C4K31_2430 [Pseudomonas chlororaphis subsp. piscium]|nr:hypothetical protein C4K31_2430 [Pseudomonas chlororaphis subsp. piscium]
MSDTPVSLTMPPEGYGDWLADLKGRIYSAALAIQLYWQIGNDILIRQAQKGWGPR